MDNAPKSWHGEEAELRAVLASDLFARAPSLGSLLEYICQKRFSGEDHLIKEYNIAVEALGRPADFDQKRDSIVRVEAHRLRKRLKQYYLMEGANHEIEIEIPSRGYAPIFKARSADSVTTHGVAGDSPSDMALDDELVWDDVSAQLATDPAFPVDSQVVPAATRKKWNWRLIAGVVGTASVVLILAGVARMSLQSPSKSGPSGPQPGASVTTASAAAVDSMSEIRIACGSSNEVMDREGHVWIADRYFTGGTARKSAAAEIDGSQNPELFHSRREGQFTYRIPLKKGSYELSLAMAEPATGAGEPMPSESSRLFDVLINGKVVLSEFDLFAETGAQKVANWRVFKDIQPDEKGYLTLEFRDRVGGAILNGISVSPGSPGRLRPIRVTMRERPYTDDSGRLWVEDRYYSGGRLVKRIENITGTDDPEIYRGERYGRLKYTIPVPADSTYTIVMHFAETWFGGTGQGGVGSRLFDVLCNGQSLVSNFDVYKEAGGPFRAITRVFRGLKPRDNGKLVLEMIPSRNYAFINAIEVLDESPGDNRNPVTSGSAPLSKRAR